MLRERHEAPNPNRNRKRKRNPNPKPRVVCVLGGKAATCSSRLRASASRAAAAAAAAAAASLEGERSFDGEDDFPGVGCGAMVDAGRRAWGGDEVQGVGGRGGGRRTEWGTEWVSARRAGCRERRVAA